MKLKHITSGAHTASQALQCRRVKNIKESWVVGTEADKPRPRGHESALQVVPCLANSNKSKISNANLAFKAVENIFCQSRQREDFM